MKKIKDPNINSSYSILSEIILKLLQLTLIIQYITNSIEILITVLGLKDIYLPFLFNYLCVIGLWVTDELNYLMQLLQVLEWMMIINIIVI